MALTPFFQTMTTPLTIWICDPFHTGSHAAWSLGIARVFESAGHTVVLHTLPGRHWKWRMHGAAATWAPLMRDVDPPDVLITTDMCDVAQLRGLMPRTWTAVKVVTMFHENQLTFPWSPDDPDRENGRNNTYAYVNLTSALASDAVWFNSKHHMEVFMEAGELWMKAMPKPHVPHLIEELRPKSRVMHMGLDLQGWERHKDIRLSVGRADVPTILWNHRWAWDKGTDTFMAFAREIIQRNFPAQFVILGQSFSHMPQGWESLRDELGERCLQWGYAESKEEYISWLWRCDVVPVAPHQEYFGLSVVEAMRCEVMPWVPDAHAYPETTPNDIRFLPSEDWIQALEDGDWKRNPQCKQAIREHALQFDWAERGPAVLEELNRVASNVS